MDWNVVLTYGVGLVAVVLVAGIVVLGRQTWRLVDSWLHAKLGQQRHRLITEVVRGVVEAVEQLGLSDQLVGKGQVKLREAIRRANEMLAGHGLGIKEDQLITFIEAAVKDMRAWDKSLASSGSKDILRAVATDAEDEEVREAIADVL